MIQLRILSGKQAGSSWAARRFPVRIGRSPECSLRLEDPGVWDRHLAIEFKPREGFFLTAEPNAVVAVNSQPVETVMLRNGDVIDAGAARLRFWLGETKQAYLDWREYATWAGIAILSLGQIGLIYWLLQAV